jgi:hypothetical protein
MFFNIIKPPCCASPLVVLLGAWIFFFITLSGGLVFAAVPDGAASITRSAQTSSKPTVAFALVKPANSSGSTYRPTWQDLTPAQQISLQPLALNWSTMEAAEKRKWIAMAANYAKLTPAEQIKLHSRMTEWSSLSKQQRSQARLNFAKSKQLTSNQKTATWEAYRALSPEERKKLVVSAPAKPKGAAMAIKPVPAQKLARIPVASPPPRLAASLPTAGPAVDRDTLLPHLQTAPDSVSRSIRD